MQKRLGYAAGAGEQNDRDRRLFTLHLPGHIDAGLTAEKMVGHDQINRIASKKLEGFIYSGGAENCVSRMLEDELAKIKTGAFIIYSQNQSH
jgi:hypothetical protein